MAVTIARVPTVNGNKYLQQLCKHWSHKLPVDLQETHGIVTFPDAAARFEADADTLRVTIEAADAAVLDRMKDVVARHLDRFAFREAPLSAWHPDAG